MSEYPNFITEIPDSFPIPVKVFSKYSEENYDTLDDLAKNQGYEAVESETDEEFRSCSQENRLVGLQNSKLHSGWIATMNDYDVKAEQQIGLLKEKVKCCKAKGEDIIVGFCQTGQFSIGYSIYVKKKA